MSHTDTEPLAADLAEAEHKRRVALKAATRDYVAAALSQMFAQRELHRQSSDGGQLKWVRASSDSFLLQPTVRPWWEDFVFRGVDEIHALPEHQALLDALRADPELSLLLNGQISALSTGRLVEEHHVTDHLIWTMADRGGLDDFDIEFAAWDRELRSKQARQVWIAPLMGLSASSVEISLGEGLSLSRLSDEEISILLMVGIQLHPTNAAASLPLAHVGKVNAIRLVREHPRTFGFSTDLKAAEAEWSTVNGLLEDVLVALRIFKAGRVGNTGFAGYFASWPLRGGTQFGGLLDFSPPARQFALDYTLTEEDAARFPKFFAACQSAKRSGSVRLAMRRFAYASDRSRAEDRIIDMMIAAEALFLADAEGELSYRLALRGSFFLDPELGPRSKTLRFLKTAYAVRSKIAHGSKPEAKLLKAFDGTACATIDGFATELEQVMRTAIRKAVEHVAKEGAFLAGDSWDSLILGD